MTQAEWPPKIPGRFTDAPCYRPCPPLITPVPDNSLSHFIALALFDVPVTIGALLDAIDILARDFACAVVWINVSSPMTQDGAGRPLRAFATHGYRATHGVMLKTVDTPAPAWTRTMVGTA